MMPILTLDLTGRLVDNLITNEEQPIVFNTSFSFAYVLVDQLLFFANDLIVDIVPTADNKRSKPKNVRSRLQCWVDYIPILKYSKGSDAAGKIIYSGIVFSDSSFQGTVFLTYRAVGSSFGVTEQEIVSKINSPNFHMVRDRFDSLITTPVTQIPPAVVFDRLSPKTVSSLRTSVINSNTTMSAAALAPSELYLTTHLNAVNPHRLSAIHVSLQDLPNWKTATDDQAALGAARDLFVTPSGAAKAVKSSTNVASATTTTAGTIRLNDIAAPDQAGAVRVLTTQSCINLRSIPSSQVGAFLSKEKICLTFNFTNYDFSPSVVDSNPKLIDWPVKYGNSTVIVKVLINNFSNIVSLIRDITNLYNFEYSDKLKKVWLPNGTDTTKLVSVFNSSQFPFTMS
jgi:hypothetical protein